MQGANEDLLGRYDEAELVELSEAEVHGGTNPTAVGTVIIGTLVSWFTCPTVVCSNSCP
ncbi:hypothetical protein GCM10010129_07900 [Streptomyces fumigatiscleroticus]|nr:hypothetical protein GCM10010129_07900 [Streptomyces fumigatiscleroticus]